MVKVTFKGRFDADLELEEGSSLLAAASRNGLPLVHRCGGHARCGRCLVAIEEGAEDLSGSDPAEARILRILNAGPGQRLACQARVHGAVRCRVD